MMVLLLGATESYRDYISFPSFGHELLDSRYIGRRYDSRLFFPDVAPHPKCINVLFFPEYLEGKM